MNRLYILLIISIYMSGCSWVVDFPRSVWGSSTRVLSKKRAEAATKKFSCSIEECFAAVKSLTLPFGAEDKDNSKFVLFAEDPHKRYMIIMDVPESVDTTEVGVFFDPADSGGTKIDISSLSSRTKQKAAEIIFAELSNRFSPDL